MELWRIAASLPAPRFNIVSKPNAWSRAVAKTAQRAARGEPEGIDVNRVAYWSAFAERLAEHDGLLRPRSEPPRLGYYSFTIDAKKSCYLYAYRLVDKQRIGVYVAFYGPDSRRFFEQLGADREEIEQTIGEKPWWEEVQPDRKYYIGVSLENARSRLAASTRLAGKPPGPTLHHIGATDRHFDASCRNDVRDRLKASLRAPARCPPQRDLPVFAADGLQACEGRICLRKAMPSLCIAGGRHQGFRPA